MSTIVDDLNYDFEAQLGFFFESGETNDDYDERLLECYIEPFAFNGKTYYRLRDRETGKKVVFDFENNDPDFFEFRDKLITALEEADEGWIEEMKKRDGQWRVLLNGPIKYETDHMIAIDGVPYNLSFEDDFFFFEEFDDEEDNEK